MIDTKELKELYVLFRFLGSRESLTGKTEMLSVDELKQRLGTIKDDEVLVIDLGGE